MAFVLYRAIKGKGPTLRDFLSDHAVGEEPRSSAQLHEPIEWSGISTFDDVGFAMQMAIRWRQGLYLAVLNITDEALATNVIVRQTGKRNRHHHSVMASPNTLLALVDDNVLAINP